MNIHIVFLIAGLNMMAYRASKVLLSLFAIELGVAQFFIGIMIAMYGVFQLVFALYAGKLSDRLGVRYPMQFGSAGLALGMLLPFVFPGIPALYASATLIGASHIFYNVAIQNLVGYLSTAETRMRNVSNFTLIASFASILGPLMAGVSIDHVGHGWTYFGLAVLPMVAVVIVVLFARGLRQQQAEKSASEVKVVDAASLLTNIPLRRVLVLGGIVLTGNDLFQFYMPIYGRSIDLSASAIGAVMSCFGVAAFVVRVFLPTLSNRLGPSKLFLYSILLGAFGYLLVPMFEHAVMLGVVAFVLGLGVGCCQPLALVMVYERTPPERTGEALGLRLTINNMMHISVPLVFGVVGSAFGIVPVFVANAIMLASGALLVKSAGKS